MTTETKTDTILMCSRYTCDDVVLGPNHALAWALAEALGWTRDGQWFYRCHRHGLPPEEQAQSIGAYANG